MIKILDAKKDDLSKVFSRSQLDNSAYQKAVKEIVDDVKERGDKAVFEYTKKFDNLELNASNLMVSEDEIEKAYKQVEPTLLLALRESKRKVFAYHQRQADDLVSKIYEEDGNKLGWLYRPMQKAGLYIPGGKASYPSSILMCAIPAIVAGVEEIVLVTPNPKNPLSLVAARECGIKKIYKIGGAQAIAALAFGTESIEKVNVIAGPGNVFVTLAKKEVFGNVAIDMIAGPSEILVIADESANASFVASDLLSQAEHDEQAASILVTDSIKLAGEVAKEVERQSKLCLRREIIEASISENGAIIVVDNIEEALKISDKIAPEHLEICTKDAERQARRVKNAGAIFIGNYSPEPLGDYFAGPSHCLPTSGTAKHFSVLNVSTFTKRISYINYSKTSIEKVGKNIVEIAKSEGLDAHAASVLQRLKG